MCDVQDISPEPGVALERSKRQIKMRDPGGSDFLLTDTPRTDLLRGCRLSALAAIAVFPILTLLLIGLSKAENVISGSSPLAADLVPVDPPTPALGEIGLD